MAMSEAKLRISPTKLRRILGRKELNIEEELLAGSQKKGPWVLMRGSALIIPIVSRDHPF